MSHSLYVPFFGLAQPPFSIAPDPRYLFMSERHREALAHLLYGVDAGGGFVLLTGEIGAGKTTVCRCFLEQVPEDCQVGYIVNPKLSVAELLQTVAEEFGIAAPPPSPGQGAAPSVKAWVDVLNHHLLAAHARGLHCVLIIDEAQHLSAEVLEQLRLLTNLETHQRKLLQIILIGQPELRDQLAAPGMEQLAQRVIARYHLQALSAPETVAYVAHRLAVAGLAGPSPFDSRALRRIHATTAGVPRRINLLCDRALLGAYAQGRAQVGAATVDQAAQEVFGSGGATPSRAHRAAMAAAGLAGLAVLLGALWLALGTPRPARAPAGDARLAKAPAPAVSGSAPGAEAALAQLVAEVAAVAAAPAVPPATSVSGGPQPAAALASAPATAASAVPPLAADGARPPLFDAAVDWQALQADESQALRDLAAAWGVALAPGAACNQAAAVGLACWRHRAATLPMLQQLDRPVVLVLADAAGRSAHARLLGLGPGGAVLAAGARRWTVPTDRLGSLWRGELVTLWRLPQAIDPALATAAGGLAPGASGPAVLALQQALARARSAAGPMAPPATAAGATVYDSSLRQQVAAFQLAAGLNPDGLAGPTTFMQLNRALAVDEPRLARE